MNIERLEELVLNAQRQEWTDLDIDPRGAKISSSDFAENRWVFSQSLPSVNFDFFSDEAEHVAIRESALYGRLVDEIKYLFLLLLENKHSKLKKNRTLFHNYAGFLRNLARIAFQAGVTLEHAHTNTVFQTALFSSSDGLNAQAFHRIKTFLHFLEYLKFDPDYTGIKFQLIASELKDKFEQYRVKVIREKEASTQKNPLIPKRLFLEVLARIFHEANFR